MGTGGLSSSSGLVLTSKVRLKGGRNYGWGMDALVTVFSLGMHAPATVFSWNTNENYGLDWMLESPCSLEANGIMVWAWMLQSPYSLGTRTNYGLSGMH